MPGTKFGTIERLTARQAAFVSEYLKNGGNATEAYKKAGYASNRDEVIWANAARLLKTEKVARAISKRQAERNERMQLEEDFELKKAVEILEKCCEPEQVYNFDGKPKKDKNGNAVFMFDSKGANQALTTICRLRGKFRDKLEVTQDISDRANRLAQILSEVEKDQNSTMADISSANESI